MMGRISGQLEMIMLNPEDFIPADHLLKKIDSNVSFSFIYDTLSPYYSSIGRPSIDPVSLFKMLLVGSFMEANLKDGLFKKLS